MIGLLDEFIISLVLILPKIIKDNKLKNNKLMPLHIDDYKLLKSIKQSGLRLNT